MTKRTVIWTREAEAELAEIWLASGTRKLVTYASSQIDAALKHQAEVYGSSLAEGIWALDEPPLRVLYEILDADCVVRILQVKLLP